MTLLPLSVTVTTVGLVVGNTLDPVRSRIGVFVDLAGIAVAVLFVIGLYVRPLLGPGATVHKAVPGQTDRIVILKRVHPAFAAAVTDMNQARLTQTGGPK